jgi:hypothetical protein
MPDLTIPFAMELVEKDRKIARMTALLKLIDERDMEWNLFNIPSGGHIRQEIKQILAE